MPGLSKQQLVILGGVAFTATVAIYNTVYLPFYSPEFEAKLKNPPPRAAKSGNSVWANLDREAKSGKE